MSDTQMEYEKAIDCILSEIRDGNLTLGSRLPAERALAEKLDIGRNSTREALSILSGMGIVERIQGSGNYISNNCSSTVLKMLTVMLSLGAVSKKDVCQFRKAMDTTCCTVILEKGLSSDYALAMENCLKAMERASGHEKACLDREFHILLVKACDNPLLDLVMEATITVYRQWIDQVIEQASEDEQQLLRSCHEGIFQALKRGNSSKLHNCISLHYGLIEKYILGY